jgi:hypothetical protein
VVRLYFVGWAKVLLGNLYKVAMQQMILEKIAILSGVIAGIGIYAKLYYASKLHNKGRKGNIATLFQRDYGIQSLFPLKKNKFTNDDLIYVKKANTGLLVFYIGMACTCLMSFIYFTYFD